MSDSDTIDLDKKLVELLKLPAAQRIELAERLVASVGGFASPEIENAWLGEADRRYAELKSGTESGISAATAIRDARRELNERRQTPSARPSGDD